jgi:hypothetical protein
MVSGGCRARSCPRIGTPATTIAGVRGGLDQQSLPQRSANPGYQGTGTKDPHRMWRFSIVYRDIGRLRPRIGVGRPTAQGVPAHSTAQSRALGLFRSRQSCRRRLLAVGSTDGGRLLVGGLHTDNNRGRQPLPVAGREPQSGGLCVFKDGYQPAETEVRLRSPAAFSRASKAIRGAGGRSGRARATPCGLKLRPGQEDAAGNRLRRSWAL